MDWKPILLTCAMLAAATIVMGQTEVSGTVTGDWTVAGSPYIVVDNCTVPLGGTLTIHHGVEVLFNGLFYLRSYGTLLAQGTQSDSVVFASNLISPGPGDWRYVRLVDNGAAASRFDYCLFLHGQNGVFVDNSDADIVHCRVRNHSDSGIKISNGGATVDHCTITDNGSKGILANSGAQVTIQYCEITDNTSDGIEIYEATGILDWNTLLRNGDRGIYLYSAGDMLVRRDVVATNTHTGVYVLNTNDVQIWNCTITQNLQHGVYSANSPLTLGNTIVDRNTLNGVGIQNSSFTFIYNDVWNNGTNYVGCNAGAWDISANPMYVNASFDYHLQEGSPCIDAGWPGSSPDPDGTVVDIGVYYFDQNHPPQILSFSPTELDTVLLNDTVTFWVSAMDPDGDSLRYEWYRNSEPVGTDSLVDVQFTEPGAQLVIGKVLDGHGGGVDSVLWNFLVYGDAVIGTREGYVPQDIWLGNAYPNPFNSSVAIPFYVYSPARITISLYDILGREVAVMFDQTASQGEHSVYWQADDVPSGLYFVVLHSPKQSLVKKLVRLN
jgi:hypothetical protein